MNRLFNHFINRSVALSLVCGLQLLKGYSWMLHFYVNQFIEKVNLCFSTTNGNISGQIIVIVVEVVIVIGVVVVVVVVVVVGGVEVVVVVVVVVCCCCCRRRRSSISSSSN